MGVFRNFPYSNFHEMNMDEIIKIIKNMLEEWANYHAEWDQWMADLEASWAEYQDDVNAQWTAYQNTMNTAWQSMQNFINNYFDNLDVQEEINNKIVSMIQTGEFGLMVNEYVPPAVNAWLNLNITQPTGVVIDTSLTIAGACADAKATGDAINNLKMDIGPGKLIENGEETPSGYYKKFSTLSAGTIYKIEVIAHITGTYDLSFATTGDSSTIVDTISGIALTAEVPYMVRYTPSSDVTYARLWLCDSWDIKIYSNDNLWDEAESITDYVETVDELSQDNKNTLDRAFTKVRNKNLFNKDEIIEDKYYLANGEFFNAEGWDTSNAIPVEQGKTYYFSLKDDGTRTSALMWYLILFSENDTVLDYDNTGLSSYTPQNDGILHFTWRASDTKSDLFFGEVNYPDYYDEFGYSFIAKEAESMKPYMNITWACVGDSLTEYNATAKKHYFDYISEELGFSINNYGVSGSGYAALKDMNRAFYQRILAINEPFDVLTIFGSVNDIGVINDVPLGTYEDTGTNTIGGCINTAIDNFYTIAPLKQIGIISQPPSIGTANNGHLIGTTAQAYNDLLAQICANRSIPFLDMFNSSGLRPWDSDFRTEFYNEDGLQDPGVHPNSKGQEILSTKIREFMKSLI